MLKKLFGKNSQNLNASATGPQKDPANDPNMIRVYDEYGREFFITKQEWRDNVLPGNLKKVRDRPDELYNLIVAAIRDGFAADVISYAEHLKKIDPIPSRGAVVLGIVYMEVNRLEDAQRVLEDFTTQHGEDGIVFTNLAKVYSRRGDHVRAEEILWHALELDPNQENGLGWYAVIYKERDGELAALDAYRRVAKLPRSWRARLWLARDALQHQDLTTAELLYTEALQMADHPLPVDMLMQISGDLGNAGYLAEIIRLVGPHFDPGFHGLPVGNNLIKANLGLGWVEEAQYVLEKLYSQQRPDWKQALNYWETETAKARTAKQAQQSHPEQLSVSLIGIEGPIWMRDSSPFAALLQPKRRDATRIAIFGSTAIYETSQNSPGPQLTDGPGRLSRAVPLKLAELIHLSTDGVGFCIIPWVEGEGFALFGQLYDDATLCDLAGKGEQASDFIIGFTIDATQPTWKLGLRIVRCADRKRLEQITVEGTVDNLGQAVQELYKKLNQWLVTYVGIHQHAQPAWHPNLPHQDELDYLVRLEQQLAVICKHFAPTNNFKLYGEREMLDGTLQLCLRQSSNPSARMLYAEMLRQMKKARPEILSEYKGKTERLQAQYPLNKELEVLLEKAYSEAFQ